MIEQVSRREQAMTAHREHVRSKAADLGLTISKLPGGYRLLGKRIDLWVSDLYYVTDMDLNPL